MNNAALSKALLSLAVTVVLGAILAAMAAVYTQGAGAEGEAPDPEATDASGKIVKNQFDEVQGTVASDAQYEDEYEGEPYTSVETLDLLGVNPSKEQVVGAAEYVFIGSRRDKISEIPEYVQDATGAQTSEIAMPQTQYKVRISEDRIKFPALPPGSVIDYAGDGRPMVLVNQQGGRQCSSCVLELKNDDPLMNQDAIYMLSLKWNPERSWFEIVAQPEGKPKITDSGETNRENSIAAWSAAYQNEIPLDETEPPILAEGPGDNSTQIPPAE